MNTSLLNKLSEGFHEIEYDGWDQSKYVVESIRINPQIMTDFVADISDVEYTGQLCHLWHATLVPDGWMPNNAVALVSSMEEGDISPRFVIVRL